MHKLSESLRAELRIPFGAVVTGKKPLMNYLRRKKIRNVIAVGDACSRMLANSEFTPKVLVIDERIRRKRVKWGIKIDAVEFQARSRAGTISKELFELVRKISKRKFSKPVMIRVKGEEDLAVLPVVNFFPIGYVVVYGLFTKAVVMKINRESKKKMGKILRKMKAEAK
ncbi:MAG: DUF359 domain-containing protein [Candidatus Aenigmatarchaeota archaeon]